MYNIYEFSSYYLLTSLAFSTAQISQLHIKYAPTACHSELYSPTASDRYKCHQSLSSLCSQEMSLNCTGKRKVFRQQRHGRGVGDRDSFLYFPLHTF